MSKISVITLGSDPEYFLLKDGKEFYPSCDIIGGTKKNPKPLPESGIEGLSIQEDNVAVEITTAACKSKEELVRNILQSIEYLPSIFPKEYNLSISEACSANFDPKYLTTKKALEFGCDPDINAYTNRNNEISSAMKRSNFRTCGGHVHVGIAGNPSNTEKRHFVRLLDLYLGVPSLFLDKDTERRKLYGSAGAFRYKPYGLEYRTLSNFWTFRAEKIEWVWDAVQAAVDHFNNAKEFAFDFSDPSSLGCIKVQTCINSHDLELAKILIKDFKLSEKFLTV